MTQAERDALDMCAHFEDSSSTPRNVAECREYMNDKCWSLAHEEAVIKAYMKFVYDENKEMP